MRYPTDERKLSKDVTRLVTALIKGAYARRVRIAKGQGSEFDLKAVAALEEARDAIAPDIQNPDRRRALGERVMFSIAEGIPYGRMGECFCCENKFYGYRRRFCTEVARRMGFI